MNNKQGNRIKEGINAGIFGLGCNLGLAAVKFLIGIAANSITIIADAANNMTDGVSALLTILGFRVERNEKDELHPYGHGRIEYVTSFSISLLILGTGFSVGKEAVRHIFYFGTGTDLTVVGSAQVIIVFAFSVLIKLGMMFYYRWRNKKLNSPALEAVRKDSLSDACASLFTLLSLLIMPYSSTIPLDGIAGLIIAVYIAASGAVSLRDSVGLLLGEGMSQKTEIELRRLISECPEIENVEEIKVHDYGPNKKIAVAVVCFTKSCDNEMQCKSIDDMIGFCKDKMNIELSLYGMLYKQTAVQGE